MGQRSERYVLPLSGLYQCLYVENECELQLVKSNLRPDSMDKSSSETTISGGFQVTYGDGTTVSGDWVNDTVVLSEDGNNYQVSDVQFGVAFNTTSTSQCIQICSA